MSSYNHTNQCVFLRLLSKETRFSQLTDGCFVTSEKKYKIWSYTLERANNLFPSLLCWRLTILKTSELA